jgi:homoserine O-acetyltransferase
MLLLAAAAALSTASLGECKLESGLSIPDCQVTYRTYGTLNRDKSNVVLFPTWFNGNTEDLARYVGPDGLIDPAKYYVITVDALGNGSSSSPGNSTLKGNAYPRITIKDMVESQHRLLTEKLGIRSVYAVMGISMGGMQTFQWAVSYPGFMKRAVSIVGTPQMSEKELALWRSQIPARNAEAAPAAEKPPATRRSRLDQILGAVSKGAAMYEKFRDPFGPLRQFEAMSQHDIRRYSGGTFEDAAKVIQARMLIIVASEDKAVSPDTPLNFAKLVRAETMVMDSPEGHNAYKTETAKLFPVISRFLEKK